MRDIRAIMDALSYHYGYAHACAIRLYERDGVKYINVNPVCKAGYSFAKFISKLHIANDNHAR